MAIPNSIPVSSNELPGPIKNLDPHSASAYRIAGIYLVAGILWIGLSDLILVVSGGLTGAGIVVSMIKGVLFVLLSTCLVYWLCRREYRNTAQTMSLLRAVVEGTTDAVFVKDRVGRYLLLNEAAAWFIGRNAEEILGQDDRHLFNADDAKMLMANDQEIIGGGKVVTLEETITSGGETRTFQATKAPYMDSRGIVSGVIGISRNITESKLVESTLRETELRLHEAQKIARMGSWSWEPKTNRVWWSEAEFELFKADPAQVHPSLESFLGFLHPDDRGIALARVEAMQAGDSQFASDLRVIRGDGELIWIHSQARATRDSTGAIVRVEGTDQDITAQRLAQEAAIESEARLQAAVEVAQLGVIIIDYEKNSAELSTRAAEQFGFAPGTKTTRDEIHSRFHPDDSELLRKLIADAIDPKSSGCFALEHRVVQPDGTTRWLNVRKQITFNESRPQRAVLVAADVTDRKKAEVRIREQEMLVREAAELAKVGGWGFDPVTLEADWTPEISVMYGLDPDSPPSIATALDYFCPEQVPALESAINAARIDGIPHDMELELNAADGQKRWVRTICRPIVENGRVVRVRGSLQDITDRKRAEAELRASEERYRMLFDSNPHPMWVYDVNTLQFLAVNDAAVMSYGYSREEFLSSSIREIRPAEDVEKLELAIARTERGLSHSSQWRHRRKDGRVFDVDVSSHDLPGESGHSRLVLALDITDRKKAEAELLASERRLRLALEAAGAVAFVWDIPCDSVIRYFSTEPALPVTSERATGLNDVRACVHLDDLPKFDARLSACLAEGKEYYNEYRVVRPDGTTANLEEFGFIDRADDGSPLCLTGMVLDVTDRVKATEAIRSSEERLRQSQKMEAVGRLAGGVAHDFNNLLTVINVFSELLLTGVSEGDPARVQLAAIHDAGVRAARLTKQLLSFSRKSIVEQRLVNLNDLVEESTKLFDRLIGEDIIVSLIPDPAPVSVMLDPGQLEQVLMNLALNARDAMPTGGRLTIETGTIELKASALGISEQSQNTDCPIAIVSGTSETGINGYQIDLPPGKYAWLEVTDTGCGMSPEVRNKIFEPFFTTKGIGKGTGLGLAVVHGVVQQSGGAIHVESTVGVGTSFKIFLPLATSNAHEAISIESNTAPRGGETLIVVEDEDAVRNVVRVALEGHGYVVLSASGGKEALDLLDCYQGHVALLVTDVIMPGISGRELATAARNARPGLQVLYMSGYTDDAIDRQGPQESTDPLIGNFIQKPFTPLGLARRVRAILDHNVID